MLQLLAIGILVVIVNGAEYETLQKDLDYLNTEVQTFLRDNEYYSIDCGNGYTRHYREKPLDEEYSCWSSVEDAVLEVFRESTQLSTGRRTAVRWQYELTPTYWTFNGERRWCVAQCSEQETTDDHSFLHSPSPPTSDDLSKPIYWHERLPYNLLVGPADDIVSLNKSELLRQTPLLFTPLAPSRKKHKLKKRAIYSTTKNIKSKADLKQEEKNEKTACKRNTFLRTIPHWCPPGCKPIENGISTSSGQLPSVFGSSMPPLGSGQLGLLQPPMDSVHPGVGRPSLIPGQPGLGTPSLGPGHLGLGTPALGPGKPGLGQPQDNSQLPSKGLGNEQVNPPGDTVKSKDLDDVAGTSPPQHMFAVFKGIIDYLKNISS